MVGCLWFINFCGLWYLLIVDFGRFGGFGFLMVGAVLIGCFVFVGAIVVGACFQGLVCRGC